MKQRLPLFIKHWLGAVLILLCMAATGWARHPEVRQMTDVQRLARQLSLDSGTLTRLAEAERHHDTRMEDEAIRRFDEFHRSANRFYRQVNDYHQNPDHTEADYLALRDAYRRARIYFNAVHGTVPVQDAIGRTRDSMRQLVSFYSEERAPAVYDPAVVRRTAEQILTISNRLEERAENQRRRGRVGDESVKRMDLINDAAHAFRDQVIKYNADLKHIDEEYDRLVQRMLDARGRMADFTMDFQDEYGALWNLTQSINYISPGGAVGGPPYSAGPRR